MHFYLLLWNYLLILNMVTESLLRITFSVIGRCSLMPTSHWLQGKCARISVSKAAYCKHFQWKNCHFMVFEAGYWNDFQNWHVIPKEQTKTLSLKLRNNQETKNFKKQSAHVQKVPIYYYKPSKQIFITYTNSLEGLCHQLNIFF